MSRRLLAGMVIVHAALGGVLGCDDGASDPTPDAGPTVRTDAGRIDMPSTGFLTRSRSVDTASLSLEDRYVAEGACRIEADYTVAGACPAFCDAATKATIAECPSTCEGFDYDCAFQCELAAIASDATTGVSVTSATAYDQRFGATFDMSCSICDTYAYFACARQACPTQFDAWTQCLLDMNLGPEDDTSPCGDLEFALFADCVFASQEAVYQGCYFAREEACYADHSN